MLNCPTDVVDWAVTMHGAVAIKKQIIANKGDMV